jgi:hypothetical protein
MGDKGDNRDRIGQSLSHVYGKNKWWAAHISTYSEMREILAKQGLEQHHLVPEAFIRKGPPHTRTLARRVPAITLTSGEHQETLHGRDRKDRDTLNGCLEQNGLSLNRDSFTHGEVLGAIDLCAKFYGDRQLDHLAAACVEFKSVFKSLHNAMLGESDTKTEP